MPAVLWLSISSALLSLLPFLGAGCAATPIHTPKEPLIITGNPDYIWQVCQKQIKKRGFDLDRVDRRQGIITSYPQISKQWFEFWCQDIVTGGDLLESSLHTVRRIIQMELYAAGPGRYGLNCWVAVERLSTERQFVSGRVRAQEILGRAAGRLPALARSGSAPTPVEQWLPIGEDRALEAVILAAISEAAAKKPSGL